MYKEETTSWKILFYVKIIRKKIINIDKKKKEVRGIGRGSIEKIRIKYNLKNLLALFILI